ncbi:hypothetical protein PBY51_000470 [Eleginops maclovinus]|uniref:Uncharacterized protein n=1 Tax=Eleginops maclovinus TaxID=56733 RepID=A0AAN8AI35_ELEMC|nr:hypothetical protein PBY51_000470 [Eleginops maclovinus]
MPGREEKASIPFNKLPGRGVEKEALSYALHRPGSAKQQLRGRALLQALAGIMPLTDTQASSIVALTESQSVSRECWALGSDMHTDMRIRERDGGQHLLPDSTTAPQRDQGQLITSLSQCSPLG